jgi:peptide/nickel transport system substrate-binding protein
MTFYTAASGAGWIVPKKYVEKVGEDGYKKAPIGAGPYKFVSFAPGIELVMEAFDGYWRKTPSVKRLVFKVVADETTRLAALRRGEVDIVYSIRGELAEELQRTPGLALKPTVIQAPQWLSMLDQWDPKSPWHDRRVRLAANLAIDRKAINEAITLGHSRLTYSIIPSTFDYFWQPPTYPFDPAQAKKLLAEAGYPSGFDAGDYYLDISYANVQEAIANYLQQVGIRSRLVSRERASHWTTYTDKKYKNLAYTASGAFGNAATRLEAYVVAGGAYVYGSYPDIDALFKDQAAELDRKKREALLHKIQQLMHDKVMHIPIWELAFINGHGPRVQESGLGLIPGHAYSAPYEDVKLKGK